MGGGLLHQPGAQDVRARAARVAKYLESLVLQSCPAQGAGAFDTDVAGEVGIVGGEQRVLR